MRTKNILYFTAICFLYAFSAFAQKAAIDFDSTRWDLSGSVMTDFLGRKCIMGNAYLKDVQLRNGIIEVDMAVTGDRSYPGILFRMKDNDNYERFYIRPHLGKTFQNVLQYVASFNGIDSWQIYNGNGYTASANIPIKEWFHVKLEILGKQVKVYINNSSKPVLHIKDLAYGTSDGKIGLSGPKDGTAYFSNFSFKEDNNLVFPDQFENDTPYGIITDWEISQVFKLNEIDIEEYPDRETLKQIKWQKIKSLPNGLVDLSRYYARKGNDPDVIWAKTMIESEKEEKKSFAFGYSDIIVIFLNGEIIFSGNSAYASRDPSFQGIIGLNDYVYLPLKKGKNELLIALAESFGGWAFIFQDEKAVYQDKSLKPQWEIKRKFKYPESVVYDSKRDILYVSNYFNNGKEFISKVNLNGEIENLEWVKGIAQPAGMCILNDKLYVVARFALIEIDLDEGVIVNRYRFPKPGFPNDLSCDKEGSLYITDSRANQVLKFKDGKFETWLEGDEIKAPNGILIDNDKMLIGVSDESSIKVIDLKTKDIKRLVKLSGQAVMDGLKMDGKGNYLISDYLGRVFRISKKGESTLLLNTKSPKKFCADFEYIPDKKLLIIPSLEDNRIMTFKFSE